MRLSSRLERAAGMRCWLRMEASTSSSSGCDVSTNFGRPLFRLMLVDEKARLVAGALASAALRRRRAQRVHIDAITEGDDCVEWSRRHASSCRGVWTTGLGSPERPPQWLHPVSRHSSNSPLLSTLSHENVNAFAFDTTIGATQTSTTAMPG